MQNFGHILVKKTINKSFPLAKLTRPIHSTAGNYLYTASSLGVDRYIQTRKMVQNQFTNESEKFWAKMKEFYSDSNSMIFTEDLKNMTYLAEPSVLSLFLHMVKKYNTQNEDHRFSSFVHGPVMMRMFYLLDAPKEALQCFEDSVNKGFFDQQSSYHILMDLLYKHGMYDEMYRVYNYIQERQLNMQRYPKYPTVLIFAACYKQNTPESLQYASKLWSSILAAGIIPLRRACGFFAALALNQGAPNIALESLSGQKQHYITLRNIKVVALAEMGRLEESFLLLKRGLRDQIDESGNKYNFLKETINKVRLSVEKCNKEDIQNEFKNIESALTKKNLIFDQTLDSLLNTEIILTPRNPPVGSAESYKSRNKSLG